MDSTNDEFPMARKDFLSDDNEKKYKLNANSYLQENQVPPLQENQLPHLQENQVYYVIDMKNRDKIIKTICIKDESNDNCQLKEFGTCNQIDEYGGTTWSDLKPRIYNSWLEKVPCKTGGKRKSRTQKRKRTKTQKTTRIRKRRTTKKTLNKKI